MASDSGTWARLLELPVEGRIVRRSQVGKKIAVKLVAPDVEMGFNRPRSYLKLIPGRRPGAEA